METVFFDGFIFVHDQDVVQEIVDSRNAFRKDFGYAFVIIDGVFLR